MQEKAKPWGIAQSTGAEAAHAMYANVDRERVLLQMTAEVSACVVLVDEIGRRCGSKASDPESRAEAHGLAEATRVIAAHYRMLREICQRRGLEAEWKEFEGALRATERTSRALAAFDCIEATESLSQSVWDLISEISPKPSDPRLS